MRNPKENTSSTSPWEREKNKGSADQWEIAKLGDWNPTGGWDNLSFFVCA
jgi:hypothetical protein